MMAQLGRAIGYRARLARKREQDVLEIEGLAARGDLGCPLDEAVHAVEHSRPGPNWRFGEMLRRLGLTPMGEFAKPLSMLGAACRQCTAEAQCHAWLGSGRRSGYEAFCPNAPALGKLAKRA
jgi:hypothetical protein